ncbi:MAG: circularly permuted type 2 ATP-grasp protein, partial [Planctomycetota bacterium]
LLGDKLAIESVNSWWGGNAKSLAIMLDRIDEIQLMPAFRVRSGFGQLADKASVDQLALKQLNTEIMTRAKRIELLRTSPSHWVGFEKFPHSSKAYWEDGKTKPGYISIRTFATATDNSWSMLPGGLVRISETPCEIPDNPFSDGRASDAWIISDQPVRPTSLLKGTSDSIQLVRGREFLPSRIAESLFWLGRYLDRADYTSRLLRAVGTRLTGESNPADMLELPSLLRTLIKSGQLNPGFENLTDDDQVKKLEESLPRHALNSSRLNSIHFQIDQIVSLAGQIRDRLSSDAWRMVQDMSATMDDACPSQCEVSDLLDIIDSLIVGLAAYSGFLNDSMTRTKAHKFVNMGNQLEHALQIVSYVKTCVRGISRDTTSILDTMLEISDSSLTYRSRYYTNVQLPAVLDLLLLDPANPRSLIYQLKRLVTNLEQVAQTEGDSKELILAREIAESIQTMDVFQFSDLAQSSQKNDLFKLFESIEQKLPKLATLISNRHFVHTGNFVQIVEDNL